ncbi:MAG: S8 family serine peptidase [Pseudomonadota bacterium]
MELRDEWLAGGSFNWQVGYGLASASALVYRDMAAIKRIVEGLWGMKATTFEISNTEGFVAEGENSVVVALRGTTGFMDWMSNIRVGPDRSDAFQGEVHGGFLKAYGKASQVISDAIEGTDGKALWFTGHSLGGALAVVGAATHLARGPAGVVTFGQPRMLKADARAFMDANFDNSYIRVVNDDDVVPRVPPNYKHTGTLLHFDFLGNLIESATEMTGDDGGPAPLPEAEFNALVETADQLKHVEADFGGDPDFVAEGLIPGVPAHKIENYVNLMRTRVQPSVGGGGTLEAAEALEAARDDARRDFPVGNSAEDFGVETGSDGFESGFESTEAAPPPEQGAAPIRHPVLLRLHSASWTAPQGVEVRSQFSNFATVMATTAQIAALENDTSVASVELSRDASGYEDLDSSVPFVQAADIHRPPLGERGDGALVGIIDTGVDILHEAFHDASGNTRVVAIWDQTRDDPFRTPHAIDSRFKQNYGTLYTSDKIQELMGGSPHLVPRMLRDPFAHGTHVAGIAAGRAVGQAGQGGMADGMAPEAGIVLVIAHVRHDPQDPPALGYSVSHVDALAFMKELAAGGNAVMPQAKPIAINVSLGTNAGAHDGTTTLEAAFDAITGGGRDPGVVIVKSAGNERGHAGHARVSAFKGGIMPLEWESSTRFRDADYFEGWYNGLDDMAFTLIDPGGNRSPQVDASSGIVNAELGGNRVQIGIRPIHRDNGDNRLTITVQGGTNTIQHGVWTLEVEGRNIISQNGNFNMWVERTRGRAVRFRVEEPEMTLSIPGTARTVICVGASGSAIPIRLLGASSWGLTRDGRPKPDLCAPGIGVVSAASGGAPQEARPDSGTSMAAPHVTGALALVLSAQSKAGVPLSNAMQFQTALARTVQGLPGRHNVGAGFGVLNAKGLFDLLVPPGTV